MQSQSRHTALDAVSATQPPTALCATSPLRGRGTPTGYAVPDADDRVKIFLPDEGGNKTNSSPDGEVRWGDLTAIPITSYRT